MRVIIRFHNEEPEFREIENVSSVVTYPHRDGNSYPELIIYLEDYVKPPTYVNLDRVVHFQIYR